RRLEGPGPREATGACRDRHPHVPEPRGRQLDLRGEPVRAGGPRGPVVRLLIGRELVLWRLVRAHGLAPGVLGHPRQGAVPPSMTLFCGVTRISPRRFLPGFMGGASAPVPRTDTRLAPARSES